LFYNSKIDNSKEENLKNLDSKEDLFIGKFMKYTSSSSIGFNSSNENSLKNLPFVQNTQQNNNINKEEENINNDDREENKDINKNNTKNTDEIDTENKDIEKDLNFNEKNLKEEEETNNNEDNKHIKEEQKENNDNNLNNNEDSRNEDNKGKELEIEIEIIKTKKYTSTNYNDYSIPYYKKNSYYNNSKRKRYGSYHPKKYPKINLFSKGDDDYFNIALNNQDNTNIYSTITNEYLKYNDDDNYYEEEKGKTITIDNKKEDNPKEKEKEHKEDAKEIKIKRRRTTSNINKVKLKKKLEKGKKEEIKKVTIKNSGAKNLKDLLG